MRVALVMTVVSDLHGSGGAERLFSALHEHLSAQVPGAVSLITAKASLARLQQAGHLRVPISVIRLPLGPHPGRTRLGLAWMTCCLLWVTVKHRFDLVHICLPSTAYVPYALALRLLPRGIRPRLTLTVIDCTLAGSLGAPPPAGTYERQVLDAHRLYERWARLNGIFSWYQAFVDAIRGRSTPPVVRSARFCFTDPDRFHPAPVKEPLVVFAGRLSEQKRPLLFVDAVARLRAIDPELVGRHRFCLYGTGALQRQVVDRIAQHGLQSVIELTHGVDLAPLFARSKLFVSTQAIENFTSLSMLEAMAAGNAIIAEDIGQTREFVKDGHNGFLVAAPTAEGFANAMATYLRSPERHAAMAAASRTIATEVHTREHFANDITAFWQAVVAHD